MHWWLSVASANSYMPVVGSTIAADIDAIYDFCLWVSVFFFIVLMGTTVFFVFKYRRKTDNDKTPHITHSHILEFLWSFIPLVLLLGVAGWGVSVWYKARSIPTADVAINVTGKQWLWDFEYSNGKKTTNDFYIPVGKKVVLTLASVDVIHSFFIPSFRVKQDAVPGKRAKMWFEATEIGAYQVFCTEYCGTSHSKMLGTVYVVSQTQFDKWLAEDATAGKSPADLGKMLYNSKGCVACHSTDDSKVVGPTWKGLWDRTEKMADGSEVKVDENYIRESILNPGAKVVAGFPNNMISYQGNMTEDEINQIIEYIKTLK